MSWESRYDAASEDAVILAKKLDQSEIIMRETAVCLYASRAHVEAAGILARHLVAQNPNEVQNDEWMKVILEETGAQKPCSTSKSSD